MNKIKTIQDNIANETRKECEKDFEEAVLHTTGQIRRVTDLGQIVIPKDVRRLLGIKDGEPLECFIYGDMVCFKKFMPDSEIRKATDIYINELKRCTISAPSEQSRKIQKLVARLNKIIDTPEVDNEE